VKDDISPDTDLIIIQRDYPRDLKQYEKIVRQANFHRKPIVFEIDDYLWQLPLDHPDRINGHYLDALWPMLLAAQQADAIVVTTPKLLGFLRQLNSNVKLLPNYFDDNRWKFCEPTQENEVVRIGYMGGNSHRQDIQMILPALKVILRQYSSKIQLVFWGIKPPKEISGAANVEWHPLEIQNYVEFTSYFLQQKLDIFLAPLQLSVFNQCKSPIKYFECTALGSAGVCSNIDPYRRVVEHEETGFLAESIDDWIKYLGALIENPPLRNRFSRKAQENIQKNWLLSNHYREWEDIYQSVIDNYQYRDQENIFKLAASLQEQLFLAGQFEQENYESKISELEHQLAVNNRGILAKAKQLYSKRYTNFLKDAKKWRNK